MMQLPSFPEHQSFQVTDHKWIGNVPSHWELRANKYIFSLKKQSVGKRSAEYDLLSLTLRGIIKRDMENPEGKFPAEFDTYQEVNPGDFVFCHFDVEETPRTVGLSDFHGMITGAYTVYRTQSSVDPRFLLYFYLNADSNKKLRSLYTGLRNTISKDAFAAFKTPLPPLPEQRAIAVFLDEKCTKIDDAVKIKEDQIALLRERRQIIIRDVVTRGLNPSAPMKDSGIDWIGQIPAHWELKKAAWYFAARKGSNAAELTKEFCGKFPGQFAVYSGQTENEGILGRIDNFEFDLREQGCMLCSTVGAKAMTIRYLQERFSLSQNCMIITPRDSILNMEFFSHAFAPIFAYFRNLIPDHMQASFRMEDFYQMKFLLPPVAEQIEILAFIRRTQAKLDGGIAIKERQIAALKEYKSSLINAAVTGKIKII